MEREIRLAPTTFGAIEGAVRRHLAELPTPVDSYLEDHILESAHYRIEVSGEHAGFASIHDERLITQFFLEVPYRRYGQLAFWTLRRVGMVQSALVSTADQFILAHALDDARRVSNQAFLFATPDDAPDADLHSGYALRIAREDDTELIQQEAGEFFDRLDQLMAARGLYITSRGGEPVGFGVLERSALSGPVASIGMYTIDRFRCSGVGTATIALLIDECRRLGLRPVAGCWYYNHASKRTLERCGMYSAGRLLTIDY